MNFKKLWLKLAIKLYIPAAIKGMRYTLARVFQALAERKPDLRTADIKKLLKESARRSEGATTADLGAGIVDAGAVSVLDSADDGSGLPAGAVQDRYFQGNGGVPGASESGDLFAASVAA